MKFTTAKSAESTKKEGNNLLSQSLRSLRLLPIFLFAVPTQAQEPQIQASFEIRGDAWVGQHLSLVVDLLAPGFFSGTASFDLPDPPGLLLLPPQGSPLVLTENINGVAYTVQRHELSVFARHAGPQTLPSFEVRFHYKANPLDKEAVAAGLKTPSLNFTVKAPPGAENLGSLISARHLEVTESWKPEPGKDPVKPGAAFVRTITFTAPDVPAMAFPLFPSPAIDGLGIYRKTPEVLDQIDRGSITGERRETLTYVCQRPGHFIIPAMRMSWFDLDTQQLQTIDFPARPLEVTGPALPSTEATTTTPAPVKTALILTAIPAALLLLWKSRSFFRPVHLAPLNP